MRSPPWSRLRDDYKPLRTNASDIGRALTRDQSRTLARIAETNKDWEAAFFGSVLAGNTGLRGGEIKKLRIGALELERRRIIVRRTDTKTDAGARYIELNLDAVEAAQRLLLRASLLGVTKPEHYLMPKHFSRIMYGPDKEKRGHIRSNDGQPATFALYQFGWVQPIRNLLRQNSFRLRRADFN